MMYISSTRMRYTLSSMPMTAQATSCRWRAFISTWMISTGILRQSTMIPISSGTPWQARRTNSHTKTPYDRVFFMISYTARVVAVKDGKDKRQDNGMRMCLLA